MYKVPIDDMIFTLNYVIGVENGRDIDPELIEAILSEAAKLAEKVIAPTNQNGDQNPSIRNSDGSVTTPKGYAAAYAAMGEGGWTAIGAKEEFGGQNMPMVIGAMVDEMWQSANMSFALCHLLTQGQIYALQKFAPPEIQKTFIPKMTAGLWTGTMNLTEPQAGTDLGAIKTKAVKTNNDKDDDTYRITGQKIYITYGEHDMAENIIHLVLARLPNAPQGAKGLSLFIVPKYRVDANGEIGARNNVQCLSIESKLGIKSSPTAVLAYGDASIADGAIGTLIGGENNGLKIMFAMMNHARFSVGLQGLAIAERAMQQAINYAMERKQGVPIGGGTGDAIINHPDVLRLATVMKAEIEAMRALAMLTAAYFDKSERANEDEKIAAEARLGLLIPILKGWLTERSVAITSDAIQIHGGSGFVTETGADQHFRDARILPIYEGTTAIQANDLIFRKIIRDEGKAIGQWIDEMTDEMQNLAENKNLEAAKIAESVTAALAAAKQAIAATIKTSNNQRQAAVCGVNMVMMMGYIGGGWLMARAAAKAEELAENPNENQEQMKAKIITAQTYATHSLPIAKMLAETISNGHDPVLKMNPDWLTL